MDRVVCIIPGVWGKKRTLPEKNTLWKAAAPKAERGPGGRGKPGQGVGRRPAPWNAGNAGDAVGNS